MSKSASVGVGAANAGGVFLLKFDELKVGVIVGGTTGGSSGVRGPKFLVGILRGSKDIL